MIIPLQEPLFPTPVLALGRDVVDQRSSSPRTFLRFVDAQGFQDRHQSSRRVLVAVVGRRLVERLGDAVFGGVGGHGRCASVRVARGQTGVESSGHAARVGVGQRAFPRAAPRAFVCGGVGWIPRRRREVVVAAPRASENAPRAGSAVLSSKPN